MNTAPPSRIGKSASMDKPVKNPAKPKAKASMTREQRHQLIVVGIAVGVVLTVGLGIYAYFNYSKGLHAPPRLDVEPVAIAHFIATDDFDHLKFDRQLLYIKELGGKKKELEEQYKQGKLSKSELEDALAVVWLGKQLKHVDKYYSLGELDKKNYLDELVDDQLKDESNDGPKDDEEPSKDKSKIKGMVERFPDRDRRDYDAFRKALKEREKERKKEAKAAAKAARSTSRPTSRPGERPATGLNGTNPAAGTKIK